MHRQIRSVLQLLALVLLLAACNSTSEVPGSPDTPNPSPPPEQPTAELDCEREGYPCSLADVPEAVLQATTDALQGAFDARKTGDMAAAHAYLEARPDVVEVVGDDTALRFRLNGGAPAWFVDRSGLTPPSANTTTLRPVSIEALSTPSAINPQAVVGEDLTGDGKVNNRDPKRALVLAPHLWFFGPDDESPFLAERLNLLPAYEGNVTYKGNPNQEDQNITFEDYWSWDEYDAIFISTHGVRACWGAEAHQCGVVISSGVQWQLGNAPASIGTLALGLYRGEMTNLVVEYGLAMDFFRSAYPGGLDDALVSFSACETGAAGASELAAVLGGDDFVMMGWTEIVGSGDAFNALGLFTEKLGLGLPAAEALRQVEEAGLSPVLNSYGKMTAFTHFAPQGGDQRLIEVVTLQGDGAPLRDGSDLSEWLDGTIGDDQHDTLRLQTRIDGIVPGTLGDYTVRYRLDGRDLPGEYDFIGAGKVEEYAYLIVHEVALGYDAYPGSFELEAILSLPEGGESRYAANVQLTSCSFNATVSGDFSGTFDGAAILKFWDDGSIGIGLQSRGFINGSIGSDAFLGGVTFSPDVVTPGTYSIINGNAVQGNMFEGSFVFTAAYFPGAEDGDCGSCGGSLTIDGVSEGAMSGSFSLTMPVIVPERDRDVGPYIITLAAEFEAVVGPGTDPWSPFVQCKIGYSEG